MYERQSQYDVRIYVEKPEIAGTRRVVIRPTTTNTTNTTTDSASVSVSEKERIQQCAEHVLSISLTQQQSDKAAAAGGTTNDSS